MSEITAQLLETTVIAAPVTGVPVYLRGDCHYVHTQTIPSAVWQVRHSLGKYPSVTVVDSAGSTVTGDCVYIDENSLTLSFIGAFAGEAYMN